MPVRNGIVPVTVVLALGLATSGCARGASTATARTATYQYSCCRAADVTPVRRAGDSMAVHWIATAVAPTSARAAISVTLAAALSGPFSNAAAVKIATTSSPTIVGATMETTNEAGGAPVSTLRLPSSMPAGFYDLRTTVTTAGGAVTGDSVIQLVR